MKLIKFSRTLCKLPNLTKSLCESNLSLKSLARRTSVTIHKSNAINCRHFSSIPDFTKDRYKVTRGNYKNVTDEDINYFKNLLGDEGVITDEIDLLSYNVDWIKIVRGCSRVVLRPKSTQGVSDILKYCNDNNLAVCPQGGNTGLVGGSVPVFDEIILSTTLMNKIIHLDEFSGVLTCESGCILQDVDTYLNNHNMIMPLDLGAKGSCNIGGNVSTNAGGIRLLRYGSLHSNVLGVEVVLSNGKILDLLTKLKKDNTGYHLKHLFIGSEGTLGVVTKISVQCATLPKAVNVAFLGLKTFEDVLSTSKLARTKLSEILSSCEMMDELSLDVSVTNLKLKEPFTDRYPFYMLIETHGSNTEHDMSKLESFLDEAMSSGRVINGIVADEPSKMLELWGIRERISEGLIHDGYVHKYDISLPLSNFYELVTVMRERLKGRPVVRVSGYGHIGDGNLHLNITEKKFTQELLQQIEPFVFEWTQKLRGSISAEHGIGFKKTKYLKYSKNEDAIRMMLLLKEMFDPNNILNPYKVLPLNS